VIAKTLRWTFLLAGWLCLALALIGVFLPVVPTTPFVLLAAWCFSRGSQKLHRWLLDNPTFGPTIRLWEEHRVIRLRVKVLATAILLPLVVTMQLASAAPLWAKALALALVAWGLLFIWSKPSRPRPATECATALAPAQSIAGQPVAEQPAAGAARGAATGSPGRSPRRAGR
jgi:hypothetical protein